MFRFVRLAAPSASRCARPLATYASPPGGHPPQSDLLTSRAKFTEAYAMIPRGVLRDIVTSPLPNWERTRSWILARPLSGFAETFSQYVVEVAPGGGSDAPEPNDAAEGVLFVLRGSLALTHGGETHAMEAGGFAFVPPGARWALKNAGDDDAAFVWVRKRYEPAPNTPAPEFFVTSDAATPRTPMPDTNGAWATTRFARRAASLASLSRGGRRRVFPQVASDDLRHDMHCNIVTFQPGAVIPFLETHVMEHGLYVLEGKAVYNVNGDWIEVEAGDFIWMRAFCPQACYAGGPGEFRYLRYKDVNRHAKLPF
ncbi:ureidoglycine aminohydrolase [Aureococcus anophagefferens]|nr:ureidoglycine aminohydrolase [Aureococcus anophagefferens]